MAAYNPFAAQQQTAQGIPGLQGLGNYGGWQNPYAGAFHNPVAAAILQNILASAVNQNPWQQQNPLLNPVVAQLASALAQQAAYGQQTPFGQQTFNPFQQQHHHHQQQLGQALPAMGQQVSPFGQFNSPFGQFNSPLAPQSWVGQGIPGQVGQAGGNYGQVNPLIAQLAARAFQGPSPWGGI